MNPASEKGSDHEYAEHTNTKHLEHGVSGDAANLTALGYKPELQRNRSMFTLLFQSLAIAAIPYGFGAPLINSVYGGGQLSMFLGWIIVCLLDECIAISLGELAARWPTSAGPYYWSFQIASPRYRTVLSFITGWTWLVGNWTITLSVNFGFASLLAGGVSIFLPEYVWQPWKLVLIFYGLCVVTFFIVAFGNKFLPTVDTFCAAFTAITIFIVCVCLSSEAKDGRHSASYTLGNFDPNLSGWGNFGFWIGALPSAYTFSAIGMITSMAEECGDVTVKLPRALALCVPVGCIAGLFFIIPICATLPPLEELLTAPLGQVLPMIFYRVMGTKAGGIALTALVLIITLFCSISITVAASRTTWAFARDRAIPLSRVWSKVDKRHGTPIMALLLTTIIEMLLGLIYLGSSSAFNAFIAVGVIGLASSYGIPILLSLLTGRAGVNTAPWTFGKHFGWVINVIALAWICFEITLFTMPVAIPVNAVTMNYAVVVFFGFMAISAVWYVVHARHVYKGPPESDGLTK
ncbi:related to GABA permease [Fusarium torulosum]|uniref:Related to GABA permease n=1 Tax=Fusarium torulosum TaxID=33205 RepID=A0AAE8MMP4_9HYPO|nr:related to GABA permease [Fusarium torulosum]